MILTLFTPLMKVWVVFAHVISELGLQVSVWAAINLPLVIPTQPMIIPLKACLPSNNWLTRSSIGSLARYVGEGAAGLITDVVGIAVALAVVLSIAFMFSDKGSKYFKRIGFAPLAAITGILVMIGFYAISAVLNNRCP